MTYPHGPFSGPAWRMIHPLRQAAPFSGEGARLYGGRWNMKGWPTLYLATDPVTAVAEFYRGLPKPGLLAPYRCEATAIVDLTDGAGNPRDTVVERALTADWKREALIDGTVPSSWALAQDLIGAGAHGALVPSAQNRGGVNLVLWRWTDDGTSGNGARLALLDPEAALKRP